MIIFFTFCNSDNPQKYPNHLFRGWSVWFRVITVITKGRWGLILAHLFPQLYIYICRARDCRCVCVCTCLLLHEGEKNSEENTVKCQQDSSVTSCCCFIQLSVICPFFFLLLSVLATIVLFIRIAFPLVILNTGSFSNEKVMLCYMSWRRIR